MRRELVLFGHPISKKVLITGGIELVAIGATGDVQHRHEGQALNPGLDENRRE